MNYSSFMEGLLFRWLPSLMRVLMVVAAVPLILLIFAQVWLRYVFQLPLLWVEEVAVTPAFWMYMTGAAYAAYDRSHIRVGVIDIAIKDDRRRLTARFVEDLIAGPQTATLRYPLVYARSSFFLSAGILGGIYFITDTVDVARQLFWHKAPLRKGEE